MTDSVCFVIIRISQMMFEKSIFEQCFAEGKQIDEIKKRDKHDSIRTAGGVCR